MVRFMTVHLPPSLSLSLAGRVTGGGGSTCSAASWPSLSPTVGGTGAGSDIPEPAVKEPAVEDAGLSDDAALRKSDAASA